MKHLSYETLKVFKAIIVSSAKTFYTYEMAKRTRLNRSVVRSIFRNFEDAGWASAQMHESTGGRPRRDYTMTSDGIINARAVLDELQIGSTTLIEAST